ncbi:MAG: hypothetical protein LIR47_03985 [Spirochaetota bacterium]|nr:hypothetical protein [Spirochaetota bacterium]
MEGLTHPLYAKFPPSPHCSCSICLSYCARPGWPLVEEARSAVEAGMAGRLMLEFSPDFSYGILAPAFRGNEGYFALSLYARQGCTFLQDGKCTICCEPFRPLECRFCHHARTGQGLACHQAIARQWNTSKGKRVVHRWLVEQGLEYPKICQP